MGIVNFIKDQFEQISHSRFLAIFGGIVILVLIGVVIEGVLLNLMKRNKSVVE